MKRYFRLYVLMALVISIGYFLYDNHAVPAAAVIDDSCPMLDMNLAVASQTGTGNPITAKVARQNQGDDDDGTQQPVQSEADLYCERPNPNGSNPDRGGKDPKKIGCSCVRKCVDGRPTENYEDGKRCKVHCKPDHCGCPDPCKS